MTYHGYDFDRLWKSNDQIILGTSIIGPSRARISTAGSNKAQTNINMVKGRQVASSRLLRFLTAGYWIISLCWLPQGAARGLSAYGLAQTVVSILNPQSKRPELGDGVQVVVAGFGRGGAMKRALVELGYSTYDYWSFLTNGTIWDDFITIHRNKTHLIETISSGSYNAISDFPGGLLYKDLITMFPNAKVIVDEPDSPELADRWTNETLSTVFRVAHLSYRNPFCSFSVFQTLKKVFEKWALLVIGLPVVKTNKGKSLIMPRPEALTQAYSEWVGNVKLNVPHDRLLIISSENKSWKAVCDFLAPTSLAVKQQCGTLSYQRFPADNELPKFLMIVAIMTIAAECYDRLPLAVLAVVGLVNLVVIVSTRRRKKTQQKEKTE